MRFFLGRIIGSLIGAFGGPLGIGFGFLLGYLADLLLFDFQVKKETQHFLVASSTDVHWTPPVPLLAVGIVLRAPGVSLSSPAEIIAAVRSYLPRTTRLFRWQRDPLPAIAESAFRVRRSIASDHLFSYAVDRLSRDERRIILAACARLVPSERDLRAIAGSLELDPSELSELYRFRDHDPEACAILEVPNDASLDEIKRSYRRLAAQFHPDTMGGLSEEQQGASAEAFRRIRRAYERLTGMSEEPDTE